MEIEDVKRKADKLLALAASPNENEAAQAMRMLGKLLAKYELDMVDIRTSEDAGGQAVREDVMGRGRQRRMWEIRLSVGVAGVFESVVITTKKPDYWKMSFVGNKADMPLIVHFFTYLRKNIGVKSRVEFSSVADKNLFCHSATTAVIKRLKAMYMAKQEELPSEVRALVPLKKEEARRKAAEEFPKSVKETVGAKSNGSIDAFLKGKQYGKEIPLARPVESGTPNGQLE